MKYLFVHQNYPAQFLHIVRHLLAQGEHDVVFICEPNANVMPGVRRITYRPQRRPEANIHNDAKDFAQAMARAEEAARAANEVKKLGFTPDIIIGHHGWGEMLNLGDVWPDVPLLGYHEFYYALAGQDVGFDPEFGLDVRSHANVRAKNAVNLLALTNPGYGQTPTEFQLNTYPKWAQSNINLLREGVNTDVCRPVAGKRATIIGGIPIAAKEKLITYVARDLEPYRGFHQVMRALPSILRARPDARVIMVGGDGVSYGARLSDMTWRQRMLAELGNTLDTSRVHFTGKVDYNTYLQLLQRSDAHIYFTYPFVLSWSLRESLSCGCALVASDTAPVREFVKSGDTGLLTPFFDPGALSDCVLQTLEGGTEVLQRRANARAWAKKNLDMADYLSRYEALISSLTGLPIQRKKPEASRSAPPPSLLKLSPTKMEPPKAPAANPSPTKFHALAAAIPKQIPSKSALSKTTPSKSASSQPVVSKSAPSKSVPSKPVPSKPVLSKSAPSKSAPSKSAASKSAASKSAASKSAPSKPAPSKPAPSKLTPSKSTPSNRAAFKSVPAKPATARRKSAAVR